MKHLLSAAVLITLAALGLVSTPPTVRAQGSGTHYLVLVRHGIYDRDTTTDEVSGNGLNPLGHQQAQLAGARLAGLPVRPTSLVTSPLRRARETAEDIGRSLRMKPETDPLIEECTPTSFRADYMRFATPSEIATCDSNLARAWAKYVVPTPAADRHDVLVCHGNVIRWFVARAVAENPARWPSMDIGNGSLTVIAVRSDGTVRLVTFSDVGHLPPAQQTWTGRGAGWSPPPAR